MTALSLTARVSLLFAVGAASVLLGLGWVVERSVDGHFQDMDRHEMAGKLTLLRGLLASAPEPEAADPLAERARAALVGHHDLSARVLGIDGRVRFATGDVDFARMPAGAIDGPVTWRAGDHVYRGLAARVDGVDIEVALDISHHQDFLRDFRRVLVLSSLLAALLTAALGWVAARAGLRPLREMTRLAARLSASSLGERLPRDRLPAEIDALATAFNAMLTRLEDSFRRLSEFSSDLAHELRTPLSNLMTQTQVALARARSEAEYRDILASSLEEHERLARMVGDMLFLAQADNNLTRPRTETVDLAVEVARVLDFYEALAAESGVTLAVSGAARTRGDPLMLRRALSNLVSNAIRHAGAGGRVDLRLAQLEDGGARLDVENPGEIPADRLPRVFDRFYTGDPARRASGEGAGLGLAITRSIIGLHGGAIHAETGAGLTRFRVTLPAA